MTIDKIKQILPEPVYQYWMECDDIEKMQRSLKQLRWMLDYREELSLTADIVNIYYAEVELLTARTQHITPSEIKVI